MARPRKQEPGSDEAALSREKIVDVALGLIAEKGFDDFSLRDVARTLGGTVQAVNRPEGGAAVTLTLPLSAIALDKEPLHAH